MEAISLKELAVPIIKSIDSCNYLLKSHHRRTAIIAYHIGRKMNLDCDQLFRLIIAAAVHDVGALSVQERNALIQADVENPRPHCEMGYRMLSSFGPFKDVARIIRHHHIHYDASLDMEEGEVLLDSHILHLADRVDVLINPDVFVLKQKASVIEKIRANVSTTFHPDVFAAFVQASAPDIFWIEINNLELDQLFRQVDSSMNFDLTLENVLDFALTISRIIDFRSHFTASHSYTVANLACELGKIFGFSRERCLKLKISGCINACGHHHAGHIGILGVDRKGVENYQLLLGGSGAEDVSLGRITGPGFDEDGVVDAIEKVTDVYLRTREDGERFVDTYRRIGMEPFKEAIYG